MTDTPKVPEAYLDLLDAQVATLATINPDGEPQQSVLWFLAEGGTVYLSLSGARQKTRNLQRDNRCSLVITDPVNPYRYLELRGRVELADDPGDELATKVGVKYGADLSQYDEPGDVRYKATFVVQRVRPVDMSG